MGLGSIRIDVLFSGTFSLAWGGADLYKSIYDYQFLVFENAFGSGNIVTARTRMNPCLVYAANQSIYADSILLIADNPYYVRVERRDRFIILSDGTIQMLANSGEAITAIYGVKIR